MIPADPLHPYLIFAVFFLYPFFSVLLQPCTCNNVAALKKVWIQEEPANNK